MRSISRRALSALVVVLALSAAAVSSASAAQPEILPYPSEAKPLTFTVSFSKMAFETAAHTRLICQFGGTGSGSFTSPKTGTITKITFTGCAYEGSKEYEYSTWHGAVAGELRSEANIPVALLYKSKAAHEVDIILDSYEGKTEPTIIPQFRCPGLAAAGPIKGDLLLGPLTPLDRSEEKYTFSLKAEYGASHPYEEGEKGLPKSAKMSWVSLADVSEAIGLTAETTLKLGDAAHSIYG